jgi:hypothetical protein
MTKIDPGMTHNRTSMNALRSLREKHKVKKKEKKRTTNRRIWITWMVPVAGEMGMKRPHSRLRHPGEETS